MDNSSEGGALLVARNLAKYYPLAKSGTGASAPAIRAVDDVSFDVRAGETLGVVGESGSGKSTVARVVMNLIGRDHGEIWFDGEAVGSPASLSKLRRWVQMVFQDSGSSLNPRLSVGESIAFGPRASGNSSGQARLRASEALDQVGLSPARFYHRYPHELSGGQRQRVNIARAIAMHPRLIIMDEAVSALDKSIEAQVLNLMMDLKRDMALTYVFISHDLHVVRYIADRVMVMYLGKVMEVGEVDEVYATPRHPYTRALLASIPSMDPDNRTLHPPIVGDLPSPINPPVGCRFGSRCTLAEEVCRLTEPRLQDIGAARSLVACHLYNPQSGHSRAGTPSAALEHSI